MLSKEEIHSHAFPYVLFIECFYYTKLLFVPDFATNQKSITKDMRQCRIVDALKMDSNPAEVQNVSNALKNSSACIEATH